MIKFFIGTSPCGGCAENQMALEYSIKKHCSESYEIHWMRISDDPSSMWYGWNTSNFYTPFSPFRYAIPEYVKFKGRAIYQDDDQIWLDDPVKFWNLHIPDDKIMTGKKTPTGEIRHCVSLIDCERFGQHVNFPVSRRKQNADFAGIMKNITFPLTHIIGNEWNNYDGEDMDLKDIKVLHFTDMGSNPGVHKAVKRLGDQTKHWYDGPLYTHRRQDVVDCFEQYYNEAIEDGFSVSDYIPNKRIDYKIHSNAGYKANNGWG